MTQLLTVFDLNMALVMGVSGPGEYLCHSPDDTEPTCEEFINRNDIFHGLLGE
ncbi:MAG: hypothetical protein AAF824_20595 [Bacteroidota bacterium]